MSKGMGENSKKVFLLLAGGLALGLSRSPKGYFKVLKGIRQEWQAMEDKKLRNAIKKLYESKLVSMKEDKNGNVTIILTKEGEEKALKFNLDKITIPKMKDWDKKWRVILFDIPEKRKRERNALRQHLKQMGFYEFQKSVFIHPFNCEDEIDYLIEFYNIRAFVRIILAEKIDNELHLKKHFNLL